MEKVHGEVAVLQTQLEQACHGFMTMVRLIHVVGIH